MVTSITPSTFNYFFFSRFLHVLLGHFLYFNFPLLGRNCPALSLIPDHFELPPTLRFRLYFPTFRYNSFSSRPDLHISVAGGWYNSSPLSYKFYWYRPSRILFHFFLSYASFLYSCTTNRFRLFLLFLLLLPILSLLLIPPSIWINIQILAYVIIIGRWNNFITLVILI